MTIGVLAMFPLERGRAETIQTGAAAPHSKTQAYNLAWEIAATFWIAAVLRRSLSFVVAARFLVRILGTDGECDSAACGESCGNDGLARRARFDEIVQNAICNRFVKRALVSIRSEIKLERFAFHAEIVRNVIDVDPSEIGLARDRTNGREIVCFKVDPVIAVRRRIRKSLEARLRG
jgi:hypothetical protein